MEWVALTSAAAVPALPDQVRARIAAVGPATAAALRQAGHAVEHIPADYSARGLLRSWHPEGTVLLLHSDLAAPTLAEGLAGQGVHVRDVVAYRTRAAEVEPTHAHRLRTGHADVALVTSGSVARALAGLHPPADLVTACLGPRTAAEARAAGLQVAVVAREQRIETLVADLCTWWATTPQGREN